MQRSVLKKEHYNVNVSLAIKLYKKQRNYAVNSSIRLGSIKIFYPKK